MLGIVRVENRFPSGRTYCFSAYTQPHQSVLGHFINYCGVENTTSTLGHDYSACIRSTAYLYRKLGLGFSNQTSINYRLYLKCLVLVRTDFLRPDNNPLRSYSLLYCITFDLSMSHRKLREVSIELSPNDH